MAKYPDRRSAAIPALAAAQRLHGWCSPEAIEQVAAVMRLTPGYLVAVATFYDMLDTQPVGRHRVYVCTNISCSLRGGDELLRALERELGDDPDFHVRHFECLGACDIAPMASVDGVYVGPIDARRGAELVEQIRAGEPPLPDKQSCAARAPTRPRTPASSPPSRRRSARCRRADPSAARAGHVGEHAGDQPGPSAPLEDDDDRAPSSSTTSTSPACNTLDVYERRGGYEALRKALAMRAAAGHRRAPGVRRCAAAAARASRWARRSRSCPRARWTSTSSATPTSPSPGTFKDRELMQKSPHMLIEGIDHRRLRGGREPLVHLHPRRVRAAGRHPRRRARRGRRGRLPRREHPRLRLRPSPRRAPRRGRLHLRRGDRRCSTRSRASAATRA